MSSKIAIDIIKNLIKLGHDVENMLDESLLIEIVKDKEMSKDFFENVKMEDEKLKKFLKVRRTLTPEDKSYDFEKNLVTHWQSKYQYMVIEQLLRIIPEKIILADENWLKLIVNNDSRVIASFTEKERLVLDTKSWFIEKVLELNIGMRLSSKNFPWNNLEVTHKVIDNNLSNMQYMPLDVMRNPEVFNYILDVIDSNKKKNLWETSIRTSHYPEHVINNLQKLVSVFVNYDESPEKYSNNVKKTMTFENYKTVLSSLGCAHPQMNTEEYKAVLNKRMQLFRKIGDEDARYIPWINILIKGIPSEAFQNNMLAFHVVDCLKTIITKNKPLCLKISCLDSIVKCVEPYVESQKLKESLMIIKERKFDFYWDTNIGVVNAGYFSQVSDLLNKIQTYLLEEIMLKEAPVLEVKEKVLKF